MEIALLVLLFLVGTIWSGVKALIWLDRRRIQRQEEDRPTPVTKKTDDEG